MTLLVGKIRDTVHFLNRTDGTLKGKTIRSAAWVAMSNVGLATQGILRTAILARLLSPEVFGLMGIITLVHRAIEIFTETGVGPALIHRQDRLEEASHTAFTIMVVRGFVVAALVAISAPFVARYYEQPVLESAIQVMAIAFFIIGFTNINTEFQRKELNFKSLAYLQQSTTITSLVVVVALAYFLRSIWALVIGQVISVLVGVILSYALIEGRPTFKFDGVLAKGLLHYGKFITGVAVFGFIASEIDNAVVGKVLGMQALGFYVVAFKLASLPATHFSKVTARMMLPVCSKLQNDLPALRNVYVRVLEFVGHLALPLALGMGILAPELIRALYGEQWLAAVEPLQILCVYGAFMALGSWGYVFNALGKPHIPFYLNVVRAVGIAVLIYPLTAAYGLTGAASAVAIPMVVLFAAQVYAVSRVLEMDKWHILRVLSRVLANSTVMVLALVAARLIVFSSPVLALMFPMGVAGMTYLALNYRNLRAFSTGRILAG